MIQRGVVRELVDGHAKIAVGGGEGCSVCASRESCLSITGSRPEEKIITTENVLGVSDRIFEVAISRNRNPRHRREVSFLKQVLQHWDGHNAYTDTSARVPPV